MEFCECWDACSYDLRPFPCGVAADLITDDLPTLVLAIQAVFGSAQQRSTKSWKPILARVLRVSPQNAPWSIRSASDNVSGRTNACCCSSNCCLGLCSVKRWLGRLRRRFES